MRYIRDESIGALMRITLYATFQALVFGAACAIVSAAPVPPSLRNTGVELPGRKTMHIPSPDGRWMLIASPYSEDRGRTVTLEDKTTRANMLVKRYDRSLSVGWSPDSRAFFLNDAYGSDGEDAYIYWPGVSQPLKLNDPILRADAQAAGIPADHAYFQIRRWLGAKSVLVEYCGHGSEAPARQFDFLYHVDLNTPEEAAIAVRRISERVGPLSFSVNDCLL